MANTPKPTVALTAPGMMGAGIGARLVAHGCRVIVPLDDRSKASRARAEKAGMENTDLAGLGDADFILSVVSPEYAEATATRIAAAIPDSAAIYADLNAITPARARRIGGIITGAGLTFCDGGIVGGPPKDGARTMIYLSGPDAPKVAVLADHGLQIQVLHGPVGEASGLKLSYAGITKGLAALGATMMLAAERGGVSEQLIAELTVSQPGLAKTFARQIPAMLPKSGRWVSEMNEIADYIGPDNPEHGIYRAVAALYDRLYEAHQGDGAEAEILRDLVSPG